MCNLEVHQLRSTISTGKDNNKQFDKITLNYL
jgi:hypothetical protein